MIHIFKKSKREGEDTQEGQTMEAVIMRCSYKPGMNDKGYRKFAGRSKA